MFHPLYLLESGGLAHLHHVDGVLQVAHVLFVRGHVEDGREGLGQLDRELDGLGPELDGRVQAARVTCIVVLVPAVQREEHGRLVVLHHVDADVDVGLIPVVDPPYAEVPVQLLGVDVELQVMIGELEAGQREYYGLHHPVRPRLNEVVTAVLL